MATRQPLIGLACFSVCKPRTACRFYLSIRKNVPSPPSMPVGAARKEMVNYQVAQEFFNVALRRFATPMSLADAEQYLSITFRLLMAIDGSASLYGKLCASARGMAFPGTTP